MRATLFVSVALALAATPLVHGQFVEWSIPAPSEHISGLGYDGSVLVLDSLLYVIYSVDDWDGEILATYMLPYVPGSPVGLACKGDTAYFALSGTAIVYGMVLEGPVVGTWDFADSGISSISGLGWWFGEDEWLYIADVAQNLIFRALLDDSFATVEQYVDLTDCPEIHDIGGVGGWNVLPVACEDTLSPVRLYYPDGSYDIIWDQEQFVGAVGVARVMDNRFYFSDPGMDEIHRYCEDMGGVEDESSAAPSPLLLSASPNPSNGVLTVSFCIPAQAEVRVRLYDIAGRTVGTLVDDTFPGGVSSVQVDCSWIPTGAYIIGLRSGEIVARQPVLLLGE